MQALENRLDVVIGTIPQLSVAWERSSLHTILPSVRCGSALQSASDIA
jgi:hypothetical protein